MEKETDSETESVSLLTGTSPFDETEQTVSHTRKWKFIAAALALLCCILLSLCVVLLIPVTSHSALSRQSRTYFGTPQKVLTPFYHDWREIAQIERQGGEGYRYKDEEWEHLFPDDGGSVALSRDVAHSFGLPDASRTKEDSSKMIYQIAGYHQLHCMWYLREYIYYINGSSPNFDTLDMTNHVPHCIEAVRIALTCFLDPTLIPLGAWPGIPNGYKHECRNRDAMYQWAQEHGHDIPSP